MGQDVADRVQQIVAQQLGIPPAEVLASSSFADLGADSFGVVELMLAIEEAFDLAITDAEVEQLRTVGEAIALVVARQRQAR